MSDQTGVDADPFRGVVVLYPTEEEDCYANRQIVLAPGESITFHSPWLIRPTDEVFLLAFFLDTYTGGAKPGKLYAHRRGNRRTGQTRSWSFGGVVP